MVKHTQTIRQQEHVTEYVRVNRVCKISQGFRKKSIFRAKYQVFQIWGENYHVFQYSEFEIKQISYDVLIFFFKILSSYQFYHFIKISDSGILQKAAYWGSTRSMI